MKEEEGTLECLGLEGEGTPTTIVNPCKMEGIRTDTIGKEIAEAPLPLLDI